jgi:hypothetical protein
MTARQAARYQSPAPASPSEAGVRNPQERRSNPRFLHLLQMKKAGQAAGYSSSRESGIKNLKDTKNILITFVPFRFSPGPPVRSGAGIVFFVDTNHTLGRTIVCCA